MEGTTITLRLFCWLLITTLSGLGLFFLIPMRVYADGGAPNRAYVAGAKQGIAIIDITQQKIIGHMAVAGDPQMILLSLDGNYLYVTEPHLQRIAVIVAGTGATFCTVTVPGHPTLLALDPTVNLLFAASNDASRVTSIDPDSCHIKHIFRLAHTINSIGVAAVGTSLSPNSGDQLWVATGNELVVFDDLKGTQLQQIPVPDGQPQHISIPPGSAVYVTTQQGSILAVDLNSYKVIPLLSGNRSTAMDFDENTGEIYVPDQKQHQIVVLEPVNASFALPQEPGRTIPLDATPVSVAVTSDGQLALIALANGKVAMLDIPTHQIIRTFDVGGNPHFIITGLNPPVFAATPQQARTLQNVVAVVAYVIVVALLVVPIILFTRHARIHRHAHIKTQQAPNPEKQDYTTSVEEQDNT